ncbi:MAG: flagellar hook-basal body complex protein FliE [Candidatus Jordarchaeaceae archaeon]
MEIEGLGQALNSFEVNPKKENSDDKKSVSFGEALRDFIQSVNNAQVKADKKVEDVVRGNSDDLAGAITALEESSLQFQLLIEIRNKLLEAYQEINRIQI